MEDGDEVEEEDVNPLKTLQWMFCVIEWFVNGAGSGTSCVRMRDEDYENEDYDKDEDDEDDEDDGDLEDVDE